MNRFRFLQSYSTILAVRIESEPTVNLAKNIVYDPADSDDFFQDAEYEVFIGLRVVVPMRTGEISRCSSVNFFRTKIKPY